MKWLKEPLKVNKKIVTYIKVNWTDEDRDLNVQRLYVILLSYAVQAIHNITLILQNRTEKIHAKSYQLFRIFTN